MKKSIALVSMFLCACAGAAISAAVMAERNRKFKKACSESLVKAINASCEQIKRAPRYDFSGVEVVRGWRDKSIDIPIPEEHESQFVTDECDCESTIESKETEKCSKNS